MELESEVEAPRVGEEEQTLLPARHGHKGHGLRASSLLCASFLLAAVGTLWWRGEQRISMRSLIGLWGRGSDDHCTANGQDCSSSKCCSKEGSACYKKNARWAACNQTCNPYYTWEKGSWVAKGEPIWDCKILSPVCAKDGQDCSSSKCCVEEGSKCLRKEIKYYTLEKGSWVAKGQPIWNCTKFADASPVCAEDGHDCSSSMCCAKEGSKCLRQENTYVTWEKGSWVAKGQPIWNCTKLESAPVCAKDGQDCSSSKCCVEEGSTCHHKENTYLTWEKGSWVAKGQPIWNCTKLAAESPPVCAKDGQDCSMSKCCVEEGSKCHHKENTYYTSESGSWVEKVQPIWNCTKLADASPVCAEDGHDCSSSLCCKGFNTKCLLENHLDQNGSVVAKGKPNWNCTVLPDCAENGEDCSSSFCCKAQDHQCTLQNYDHPKNALGVPAAKSEQIWNCTEST